MYQLITTLEQNYFINPLLPSTLSNRTENTTQSRQKESYKVVIINEEDLREVRRFSMTKTKLYLIVLASALALLAVFTCILVFTPLKQLVPGYGQLESNAAFIELTDHIEDLERQVESQATYTEGFKTMINSLEKDPDFKPTQSNQAVEEIPQMNLLHFKQFSSPLKGTVSHGFDKESEHYGTDIIAAKDSPILAVMDGTVIQSDWSLNDGNTIAVLHDDNLISMYKHNSILLKSIGEKVVSGEAIAIIGNSGEQSDGPHLHFELWHQGEALDPQDFIHF